MDTHYKAMPPALVALLAARRVGVETKVAAKEAMEAAAAKETTEGALARAVPVPTEGREVVAQEETRGKKLRANAR